VEPPAGPGSGGVVRARVCVVGRVQGVFFRAAMAQEARRVSLVGWVRNSPDGSVEAEIQGARSNVEAVISWCGTGPPAARVDEVEVQWEPLKGKEDAFLIV